MGGGNETEPGTLVEEANNQQKGHQQEEKGYSQSHKLNVGTYSQHVTCGFINLNHFAAVGGHQEQNRNNIASEEKHYSNNAAYQITPPAGCPASSQRSE